MHDQSYSHSVSHHSKLHGASHGPSVDELARVFNSAILSTRAAHNGPGPKNPSGELVQLMESPAFRAVLASVRQLARQENISERQAAEQIIHAFRRMDQLWTEYVFQEGLATLRNQLGSF